MVVVIAGQELVTAEADLVVVIESLQGLVVVVVVVLLEEPGNAAPELRKETPNLLSIGSTLPQGMDTKPPLDIWKHSSTVLVLNLVSAVTGAGSGAWIG